MKFCVCSLLLFFSIFLAPLAYIWGNSGSKTSDPHQNIQDGQPDLDSTTPPWLGSALGPSPESFVS